MKDTTNIKPIIETAKVFKKEIEKAVNTLDLLDRTEADLLRLREELLEKTDPENTDEVNKLTRTATQIELVPIRRRKYGAELESAITRAKEFIDKPLYYALSGAARVDKEEIQSKIIAAIEPFCGKAKDGNGKTPAEAFAENCAVMTFIEAAAKPNTILPHHGEGGARTLIAYLDESIAILESYLKAGSFSAAFLKAA